MAIKFYNIRSKEIRIAESEPHISAMWASSDRSPNAFQGQDFGWRLAPEVVVELKRIKNDPNTLMLIASKINRPLDDVDEKEILSYISSKTSPELAPVAQDADYTDEYNAEIRRLESQVAPANFDDEDDAEAAELLTSSQRASIKTSKGDK